ncbi:zf-HC2 domain-containing protein [Streptomyces broussonetiae]|uniref:Zf-HC2 domain-containing protein n=1 Tax=Streptomyces broussonetiae TaxID=2686304 RepID=A0A6I6N5D0_9ACTN|nr:zf-HC2 domain-containing protein [Streptomyces broussonetiae]QHA06664.1 zf-HC2 domain-containing protein [Streptomyces broussonetiae]
MSGSRSKPAEAHLAEQHLGDRLSALVDGELGHESRERVLAHLATCARCKAEADAQRRLKNVFAEAAPPPPSASLLARLQGLPAGGDGMSPPGGGLFGDDAQDEPAGRGDGFGGASGLSGIPDVSGVFGARRGERFAFGYVPARPHGPAPAAHERGFRIHPVGRPDEVRSASRGLRFAFVAAGAVSLAAVALGGVTTAFPGDTSADARGGAGTGSIVPARSAGSGAGAVTPDSTGQRRRSTGPLLVQGSALLGQTSAAPTSMSAPLVPGMPPSATGQTPGDALRGLAAPVMAGAAAISPLIRPLDDTVVYPLNAWSTVPGVTGSGLLTAPVPSPTSPAASAAPAPSPSAPLQTP